VLKRTTQILIAVTSVFAQNNPPAATLVTSDIANFWKAYDSSTPANRAAAMEQRYFDAGTAALKDYLNLRVGDAQTLAYAIDQRFPEFYKTARPYTLQVEKQADTILRYMARFRDLYPEAAFAPVTLVIGGLGNTEFAGSHGVVINVEAFSRGPDAKTDELKGRLNYSAPPERLPLMVIHQLAHTETTADEGDALPGPLVAFIREGAADFIAELVTGVQLSPRTDEWAEHASHKLFQDLARNLRAEAVLEGEGEPSADINISRPNPLRFVYEYTPAGDERTTLGNWIGKKICSSYYARSLDKAAAIRAIASLQNIAAIVRGSEFGSLLQ